MWQRSTSEDNSSLLDSKVDLRHLDDADLWEQYNQQNPPGYILHTVLPSSVLNCALCDNVFTRQYAYKVSVQA